MEETYYIDGQPIVVPEPMSDEEYKKLIILAEEAQQAQLELLEMNEEEYEKYSEQQMAHLENFDYEEHEKFIELRFSIDNILEEFETLTQEQQDFFMMIADIRVKQRDPNYDIYSDETIEKDFDIKNLGLEVKTMKEMLEKLFKQKDNVEAKKNLSVADFAQKYNIGKTQQQALRDFKKLPYHQLVEGGKITYIVEEVEKWFKNNRI